MLSFITETQIIIITAKKNH